MEKIELKHTFKTTAKNVYTDWLSSEGHSTMTGGEASAQAFENSKHMAWDGYITGVQLSLKPYSYIKQTWRTTEFSESDEDSILEIYLTDVAENTCELHLIHSQIPKGQGKKYKKGWVEHYFEPMTDFYSED